MPKAAIAQLYGVQQYSLVATSLNADGEPDISSGFTPEEINMVANTILERCDGIDGLNDGIVADYMSCQAAFNLDRDVPTCSEDRNGSCLSTDQKTAIGNIMTGARNTSGEELYSSFPFDPGMVAANWASREFDTPTSQNRDPGGTAFVFTTPPS